MKPTLLGVAIVLMLSRMGGMLSQCVCSEEKNTSVSSKSACHAQSKADGCQCSVPNHKGCKKVLSAPIEDVSVTALPSFTWPEMEAVLLFETIVLPLSFEQPCDIFERGPPISFFDQSTHFLRAPPRLA
ncbi:MAG TPA: hypothetical protein VNK96_03560 [Fimbriimonadales bacterium]|nr:hypothetical protein [Fimbriimonadales bacterium]